MVKENYDEFLALYEKYNKKLYSTALIILKDTQEAEDAVQDTVISAIKNFKLLREKEKFQPWILKILMHRCFRIRKLKLKVSFLEITKDIPVNENTPDDIIDIKNELIKLDYKYRVVLTLRYFNDLTIPQISEVLNIPQGTIKSQINRGLKKMKESLSEDGGILYVER